MSPFLAALDARLFRLLYAAGGGELTSLARFLSALGSGWVTLALVPFYASTRWRRLALWLSAVLAASAGVVFLMKLTVARPRPCVLLEGVHALCVAPTDPSFPSGHACGSFTLVAFVLFVMHARFPRLSLVTKAVVSVVFLLLATAIAWSRVYLGVHFPGDVVVGALLGASFGAVGGWLCLKRDVRAGV